MTSPNKFADLNYEKFRELALRQGMSRHEKVGFPDEYREGKEEAIFSDVLAKLPSLNLADSIVLEIGPGCSRLPLMLAELCENRGSTLLWADSPEMLDQLPDAAYITKYPGRYPEVEGLFGLYSGKVRTIIAYSVVQYVFEEGNLWKFVDCCLELLSDGGEMLLGDIPNTSMRRRFFASAAGIESHRQYTGSDEKPEVLFNCLAPNQMDDSVVLAILARARAQGFHAWILPQTSSLPMANRREDILIRKP